MIFNLFLLQKVIKISPISISLPIKKTFFLLILMMLKNIIYSLSIGMVLTITPISSVLNLLITIIPIFILINIISPYLYLKIKPIISLTILLLSLIISINIYPNLFSSIFTFLKKIIFAQKFKIGSPSF